MREIHWEVSLNTVRTPFMNRANSATGKKEYVDEDIFAHVKGHVDDMMILPNPVF